MYDRCHIFPVFCVGNNLRNKMRHTRSTHSFKRSLKRLGNLIRPQNHQYKKKNYWFTSRFTVIYTKWTCSGMCMFAIKWISVREGMVFAAIVRPTWVSTSQRLSVQLHWTQHIPLVLEIAPRIYYLIGLERAVLMATFPIYDSAALRLWRFYRGIRRVQADRSTLIFMKNQVRRYFVVHVHRR